MMSCVNLAPYRPLRGNGELYLGSHLELKELWSNRLPVDGRGGWISLEVVLICSSSRGRSVPFLFITITESQSLKKICKIESNL